MAEGESRAVLVTGCSSGIGRATAGLLARSGWPVYARARPAEALSDLESLGCRPLSLDVTDEESMRAAVEIVERDYGADRAWDGFLARQLFRPGGRRG